MINKTRSSGERVQYSARSSAVHCRFIRCHLPIALRAAAPPSAEKEESRYFSAPCGVYILRKSHAMGDKWREVRSLFSESALYAQPPPVTTMALPLLG